MDKLYAILKEFAPNIDFTTHEHLVDEKVITSLNLIKLVAKLNSAFDVRITAANLIPENFNSAEAIYALINSLD